MTARLQREEDELTEANETLVQRIEKLTAENGDLGVNNAALKVHAARAAHENHYYKCLHSYLVICRRLTDNIISYKKLKTFCPRLILLVV